MDDDDAIRAALEELEEAEAEVRLAEMLGSDTSGPEAEVEQAIAKLAALRAEPSPTRH